MTLRARSLAFVLAAAIAAAGCTEDLESGGACPVLCPDQAIPIADTIIDPFVLRDTVGLPPLAVTVEGYPPRGTETRLLVAAIGGTATTYAVVRYDTLPSTFRSGTADSTITRLVSASLRLTLDSAGTAFTAPVTLEVYDVYDPAAPDTSAAATRALFTPGRLIADTTLPTSALPDTSVTTLEVALPEAALLGRITAGLPVRLGLRVVSGAPAQLRFFSVEGRAPPELVYDPSADTAVAPIVLTPRSRTPADQPVIASDLADYLLVAEGTAPPTGGTLAVGGLPGRRAYLRFDLPERVLRATVVRATLILTQRPRPGSSDADTITVLPQLVLAGASVPDPAKAALLVAPFAADAGVLSSQLLGISAIPTTPADSGEVRVELVRVLRQWQTQAADRTPHALVLRSAAEGNSPLEALFFSSDADAAVRPRLLISFIPRVPSGLP